MLGKDRHCIPVNFSDLIAPVSETQFFDRHFERDVLHVERDDVHVFSVLSDSIDIEQIIHLSCHTWGEVSLAKADADPEQDDYTSRPPDIELINRAYRDGYTLVINDLQKRNLAVAELCRAIEARFFCRANVNLYMTAAGCAGLDCHYDDDDVIVIQLKGQKAWQTFLHHDRLPLGGGRYHLGEVGEIDRRIVMKPGDILYLPRGTPHQAAAQTTESLHLTISLNLLRWTDLMRELVVEMAVQEPWFRRAVPIEVLRENAEWPAEGLFDRLRSVIDRPGSSGAVVRAQERLLANPERIPSRRCPPATDHEIDVDCPVEIASDQIWCMSFDDTGAVVRAIGAQLEFPGDLAVIAQFLVRNRAFTPGKMPVTLPVSRRIDIVRKLLDHGFLVRSR